MKGRENGADALRRMFLRVLMTVAGTALHSFSVVFLLNKGAFYSSGVTGVSQIFAALSGIPMLVPVLVAALNVPLFILGWKSVSRNFARLSLLSVGVQVALIYAFTLLFQKGFDPFGNLVFDTVAADGDVRQTGTLTLAVLGGVLCGLGQGVTLRAGASTAGMDIVAQYFSLRTRIAFGYITAAADICIIVAGSLIAGDMATGVYTIVRAVLAAIAIDKVHTIYKYQKITVVSDRWREICDELIARFPHGITVYEAVGAYTGNTHRVIETIVMNYEFEEYRAIVKRIDGDAFIHCSAVKRIDGRFTFRAIT